RHIFTTNGQLHFLLPFDLVNLCLWESRLRACECLLRRTWRGGTIKAPPLQTDQTCDVVVIGSGIAGLSTAYELSRFGRSVIVIDRGKIGYGMTARTTAPCDRTRRFLLRAHPRAR